MTQQIATEKSEAWKQFAIEQVIAKAKLLGVPTKSELKPYSNTKSISGLQLVSVMECIVAELHGKDFGNEKVKTIEKMLW